MSNSNQTNRYSWIVYSGLALILLSAFWIIIQNDGMIEISADHDLTVPFWHNWIISGILILLIMVLPAKFMNRNPFKGADRKTVGSQSLILIILAVLFTVTLLALPRESAIIYFPLLKILLLITGPIIMFYYFEHKQLNNKMSGHSYMKNNQWIFSGMVTIIWIILYFFSPFGSPDAPEYQMSFLVLAAGALFSFLLNSLFEELFYRVWLQTRLEALLGTWPAIMISSVLWSIWHMAIQGGDSADIAFSNVMINQGVLGLFLGFLWAKYRNVWVLIIIHGLMNFPVQLITGYF